MESSLKQTFNDHLLMIRTDGDMSHNRSQANDYLCDSASINAVITVPVISKLCFEVPCNRGPSLMSCNQWLSACLFLWRQQKIQCFSFSHSSPGMVEIICQKNILSCELHTRVSFAGFELNKVKKTHALLWSGSRAYSPKMLSVQKSFTDPSASPEDRSHRTVCAE